MNQHRLMTLRVDTYVSYYADAGYRDQTGNCKNDEGW